MIEVHAGVGAAEFALVARARTEGEVADGEFAVAGRGGSRAGGEARADAGEGDVADGARAAERGLVAARERGDDDGVVHQGVHEERAVLHEGGGDERHRPGEGDRAAADFGEVRGTGDAVDGAGESGCVARAADPGADAGDVERASTAKCAEVEGVRAGRVHHGSGRDDGLTHHAASGAVEGAALHEEVAVLEVAAERSRESSLFDERAIVVPIKVRAISAYLIADGEARGRVGTAIHKRVTLGGDQGFQPGGMVMQIQRRRVEAD